jgi:signal transduction histidine kinase
VVDSATFEADHARLQQLFENLLGNALTHGGSGVTVRVGTLAEGFFLEDDGSGIPPADRDTVFESGFTTNASGTGFGLSIVSDITEAHGWRVDATEGTDGGARFEVRGVDSLATGD